MSRWWRAYDEAVDDPKLCLLTDKQHRAWFNLCCITSQNAGKLPALAAVAFKLHTTPEKAKAIVAELVALGLVDLDETGNAAPHNWGRRQFQSDSSTERVKRFRKQDGNVTPSVSVTPPETERQITETDSDTEKEGKEATRARALAFPFDPFWQKFPNKVGKQAAEKAFDRVRKKGAVTFENLMAGLDRYLVKTDDRPWCNPATWLNEGRWDDQPAAAPRAIPRLGSRDDVREKNANASAKLSEFIASHSHEPERSGPTREAPSGLLPFAKPA